MAQFEQITSPLAVYSENILPISAMFEDTVALSQAGSSAITVSQINTDSYEGSKCINVFANTDTALLLSKTFNFGNDIAAIAKRTGQHIFSLRLQNKTVFATDFNFQFNAYLYVNGLLVQIYTNVVTMGAANIDNWLTFGQSFNLTAGDLFNMTFEVLVAPAADPNPNISVNFDGFKLEFDDKFLGIPSVYSLPKDLFVKKSDILISETQWDVPDIGPQVVNSGSFINLFTLINNDTHKNVTNSDTFDQLNIVSNSIKTTYRNCKTIHLIRLTFNILTGVERFYQIQIRRTIDNSVVYRLQVQRNTDESIQTVEMTTRTLSSSDPFTLDGFYVAFVNNSGSPATLDDTLSMVIISSYQKLQTP